jgi:hypothetical protein
MYGLTLFGNPQVVEVEKVLHSGRLQLADVATADSGSRNQGADVTLAKIGDAFSAKPPIEELAVDLSLHGRGWGAPHARNLK